MDLVVLESGMDLPLRRVRACATLIALALGLAGCGGVPTGPALPSALDGRGASDASSRSLSLTRTADTALRSGQIDSAVGLFEQATLTDSSNALAAIGLGDALLAAGRDLDASRAFERALALQPTLPAARYGYARAMIGIQRPEVAVDHLRKLAADAPDDVQTLNALGVAQDMLGDHAAATATYRQALAVQPGANPVRNNLALSLALQDKFADAVELLRPLAEGPDATRRSRQNLALVYGLQGDIGDAERISRIDLGGADLANNLGYFATLRGLGNPAMRAAALGPELAQPEADPLLTRNSRSVRRSAAALAPVGAARTAPTAPAHEPTKAPGNGPQPLAPILGAGDATLSAATPWFADIGTFDATSADAQWQALRAKHATDLSGLGRLARAGSGLEPMLVGPLADEAAVSRLCGQLGRDASSCRPLQL